MDLVANSPDGQFCWLDLAASSADRAQEFYARMFGWRAQQRAANGGAYTRFQLGERDVGSVYQLQRRHIDGGVPSHWTPYVRVANADAAAWRAVSLGGEAVIRPFLIPGVARIALILDAVGAPIGLWEPVAEGDHGEG